MPCWKEILQRPWRPQGSRMTGKIVCDLGIGEDEREEEPTSERYTSRYYSRTLVQLMT